MPLPFTEHGRQLWKEGRSKFGNVLSFPYGSGARKVREILSGDGKPKGLVAVSEGGSREFWVYYPKVEDLGYFTPGISAIRSDGPGSHFFGSVGSIETDRNDKRIKIGFMQSHYDTGDGSRFPRKLATRYGGHRVHLLTEILDFAEKNVLSIEIGRAFFGNKLEKERRKKQIKFLIEVAEKKDWEVRRGLFGVSLRKSKS